MSPDRAAARDAPAPVGRPPLAHRVARRLAQSGLRGARVYWWLADRLASSPSLPLVEVEPSLAVCVDRRDWVADAVYRGLYERPETAVVRALVPRDGTVVDVGANIGYYSALAASLVGSGGRVLAFEPSARCLPSLRQAASATGGVVDVHEVAVGDRDGDAELVDGAGVNHSGLGSLRGGGAGAAQTVAVRTLDDLLAQTGAVDLLKVDVEGFEPQVLAGARETLASGRVRVILCEVSPEFGPVEFAAQLVDSMSSTHAAFATAEAGAVRRRPRLVPLSAADVRVRGAQFNLLLVAQPLVPRIAGLVS